MYKPWLLILFFFILTNGSAQTIEGRVLSELQQPLSLVSVVLQKDTQLIAAATTDDKGYFQLQVSLQPHKPYTLQFSLIGYHGQQISLEYSDTIAFQPIVLKKDQKMLTEIAVTGKSRLLIRKSDRYILNVEDGLFANGFSATDVLQRTPGVWVDNMGSIRLKGTQPVTIMVNDIVQRLGAEELADFLRSLKSEDISRIEIIPNPPAEFEAGGSGGIIHIILKKGRSNGWSGSANTEYWQQATKPYFTAGASLNYQRKKIYLAGTFSYVSDLRSIKEKTAVTYSDATAFNNVTDRDEKINRRQYRLSAGYDLGKTQTLGLQSIFSTTTFQQLFQSKEWYQNGQASVGEATSAKHRRFTMSGVTMNYTNRHDTSGGLLKIMADFLDNSRPEKNEFNKINDDSSKRRLWRTDVPTHSRAFTFQSDISKTLRQKIMFRSGIKYTAISRDNNLTTEDFIDGQWMLTPAQNSHFAYTEKIVMLYASIEKTFKHTSIKAGLRGEKTFSYGEEKTSGTSFHRQYAGLYPSISLLHSLNADKGTAITASYSRRLTRPALNELNPARLEFSNYTSVTGNPYLRPQNSQHFSLTYQFIKNHTAELYFIHTSNFISLSANPGRGNSIDYVAENTGTTAQYGMEYSSTVTPFKAYTVNTNFSIYRLRYRFNEKEYQQTSGYVQIMQSLSLPAIADIDLVAEYQSPFIYTNLYTFSNFNMDAGFTRKLFNKKVKLRLACTDFLNTSREKELTRDKGYDISFYRKRPTRTLRLSLTYQFGSAKKMQNKNIDPDNTEAKRRIGN